MLLLKRLKGLIPDINVLLEKFILIMHWTIYAKYFSCSKRIRIHKLTKTLKLTIQF